MTPAQQAAIEAVHGQALTPQQAADIAALVDARDDAGVAAYLSAGRKRVQPRLVTARGIASGFAGGPLAAEAVLLKLEGARDSLLGSADPASKLTGSLLHRQLGFLAGDGLDLGDPALRGMLDQFAAVGILTATDAANLKALALVSVPLATDDITRALSAAGA